jgi:glycosyltransferase involved in cell wall biosynthesis
MKPLRIVQVLPSLVVGGAETFATQLAQAQLDAGHDVRLLVLKEGGPLHQRLGETLARNTVLLGKRSRWDATILPRATRQLRRWAPDVVHTHLFTSQSWGTVAARLAGVPVVIHTEHACHDDEYSYLPAIRRQLSHLLDAVVGCSEAVCEEVRRRNYAPHAPIVCIDNGIPLQGRPRSTLDHQPTRVGTVGRMVEIKGQRFLIDALAQVHAAGHPLALTLVGDGPLRAELEAQVDALGLRAHVRFAGQVADVPEQLATFDLFALPSLSEALPMTLLEAGAAGLPMLVTTGGGGPTLLNAGAGGWAVPPGDAGALARALLTFLALSPTERRALGDASHDLVMSRYSIEATASRYEALYRSLG